MIDTTYIAPGAVALVVLRPAQLMKSSMGEMLPVEVATAAGLKYLGIDPAGSLRDGRYQFLNPRLAPQVQIITPGPQLAILR